MSERENTKRIKLKERTFEIEKMDALESVAVLKELLTKALPIDLLSIFGDSATTILGSSAATKKDMSIDEFIALEKRMLKYTKEVLPSGLVPVIDGMGNYGVYELEKDIDMVIKLLFEAVRLNYESFFLENLQKLGVLEKAIQSKTNS